MVLFIFLQQNFRIQKFQEHRASCSITEKNQQYYFYPQEYYFYPGPYAGEEEEHEIEIEREN